MSPEILTAKIVVAIFILIGFLFLSGCAVNLPLGENGKYGRLEGRVTYYPNIPLWNQDLPKPKGTK